MSYRRTAAARAMTARANLQHASALLAVEDAADRILLARGWARLCTICGGTCGTGHDADCAWRDRVELVDVFESARRERAALAVARACACVRS